MKLTLTITVIAILATIAVTTAQAGSWIPGTPTYASEEDMGGLIEKVADHAYCQGIPRFGHRGEFPYDEYVVFDCDWYKDDISCSNARYKAIKGTRRGYFKLRMIRGGSCF